MATDLDLKVRVLQGTAQADTKEIVKKLISDNPVKLKVSFNKKSLTNLNKKLKEVYQNAKNASNVLNNWGGTSNKAFNESNKMLTKLKKQQAALQNMMADNGGNALTAQQKGSITKATKALETEITKQEDALKTYSKTTGDLSKKAAENHVKLMESSQKALNKSIVKENDYSDIIKTYKVQRAEQENVIKQNDALTKSYEKTATNVLNVQKKIAKVEETFKGLYSGTNKDKVSKTAEDEQRLTVLKNLNAEMDKYVAKYNSGAGSITAEDTNNVNESIKQAERTISELNRSKARIESELKSTKIADSERTAYDKVGNRLTEYYNNYETQLQKNINLYNKWLTLMHKANTGQFASVADANRQFAAFRTECRAAGIEVDTFASKLQKTFGTRIRSALSGYGVMAIQSALRDIVQNTISVDTAMTELKKVTSETDSVYTQFLDNAESRAQKLGATLSEVVNATADYARLGYSIDEATTLADSALIYSNVGDDVESIDDATSALISTMQGLVRVLLNRVNCWNPLRAL